MRLIQGLLNTQKDIVERLSTLEGKNSVAKDNNSGGSDASIDKPFTCTDCDLTFVDMNESISHKEIQHTKRNASDDNTISKHDANRKENVPIEKEEVIKTAVEINCDTPRAEEQQGKSGDGMNDQLRDKQKCFENIFTYDDKDRKTNDLLDVVKMGVSQSFQVPNLCKGCENKTQHTLGINPVGELTGIKPFSLEGEHGKPLPLP